MSLQKVEEWSHVSILIRNPIKSVWTFKFNNTKKIFRYLFQFSKLVRICYLKGSDLDLRRRNQNRIRNQIEFLRSVIQKKLYSDCLFNFFGEVKVDPFEEKSNLEIQSGLIGNQIEFLKSIAQKIRIQFSKLG